jgi:hypothetical protein
LSGAGGLKGKKNAKGSLFSPKATTPHILTPSSHYQKYERTFIDFVTVANAEQRRCPASVGFSLHFPFLGFIFDNLCQPFKPYFSL